MRGASFTPPAIVPRKYAPMSVAHTIATIHRTVSRPDPG
jgi:hypothetical protein